MAERDIASAEASNMKDNVDDYSVDPVQTDGALDQKETTYMNDEWSQQLGYYKKIPELKADIDAKARWTVGKGFQASPMTELVLGNIRGFGKDTFNTILENGIRSYQVGGDSFAEIISNKQKVLINLKPLDPGVVKTIASRKGRIIRYDLIGKTGKKKGKVIRTFRPEQIFHLSRDRIADEIHGVSLIPAVEEIIKMRNEAMADTKLLYHYNMPRWVIELDTDDPTEIAAFKAKCDLAYKDREIMYVPKGVVVPTLISVAANATLNPLPWIESLVDRFHEATGVPNFVTSKHLTDAGQKISYLAWQQTIEEEQLYIEEQVLAQLNLEIDLEFPASLENELLSDEPKEEEEGEGVEPPEVENVQPAGEPADTKAGIGGRK